MGHLTHILLSITLLHIILSTCIDASTSKLLLRDDNKNDRPTKARRSALFRSSRSPKARSQTQPNEQVTTSSPSGAPILKPSIPSSLNAEVFSNDSHIGEQVPTHSQNFIFVAEAYDIIDESEDWQIYEGKDRHPILSAHSDIDPDDELNSKLLESTEDPLLEEVEADGGQPPQTGVDPLKEESSSKLNKLEVPDNDEHKVDDLMTAQESTSDSNINFVNEQPTERTTTSIPIPDELKNNQETVIDDESTHTSQESGEVEKPQLMLEPFKTEASDDSIKLNEMTNSKNDITNETQIPELTSLDDAIEVDSEQLSQSKPVTESVPAPVVEDLEDTKVKSPVTIDAETSTQIDQIEPESLSIETSRNSELNEDANPTNNKEDVVEVEPQVVDINIETTTIDSSSTAPLVVSAPNNLEEQLQLSSQVEEQPTGAERVEPEPELKPTTPLPNTVEAEPKESVQEPFIHSENPDLDRLDEDTSEDSFIPAIDYTYVIRMIIFTIFCIVFVASLNATKRLFESNPKSEKPITIPKETFADIESKRSKLNNLKRKLNIDQEVDLSRKRLESYQLKLVKEIEKSKKTAPLRLALSHLKRELGENVETKIEHRRSLLQNLKLMRPLVEENNELRKKVELSRYTHLTMIRNYVKLEDLLDFMRDVEFNIIFKALKEDTLEKKVEIEFLKDQVEIFKRLTKQFVTDHGMYLQNIEAERKKEQTIDAEYKELKKLCVELDLDYKIGKLMKEVEDNCVETDNLYLSYYRDYLYIIGQYTDIREYLSSTQVQIEAT